MLNLQRTVKKLFFKSFVLIYKYLRQCIIPDKLLADRTESRLREKGGGKLVTFDHMNFGLFDGSSSVMQGEHPFFFPFGFSISFTVTCSI